MPAHLPWLAPQQLAALCTLLLTLPCPQVTCVEDGLPTWLCELMVSRGNIHEAIQYVKQIEQEIQQALVIE
jgi:hypothetical protein